MKNIKFLVLTVLFLPVFALAQGGGGVQSNNQLQLNVDTTMQATGENSGGETDAGVEMKTTDKATPKLYDATVKGQTSGAADVGVGTTGISGKMEDGSDIDSSSNGTETKTTDEAKRDYTVQYNETDLDFVNRTATGFTVKKVEVRGWDPTKKQEFLAAVKTHAEVASDQDLENFAAGVLLKDDNIKDIKTDDNTITVSYKMPVKLFGFIKSSLPVQASVDLNADGTSTDRVKVKYPWTKFLFKVDSSIKAPAVQAVLNAQTDTDASGSVAEMDVQTKIQTEAQVLEMMSNIMKSMHDTAKSIIQNMK